MRYLLPESRTTNGIYYMDESDKYDELVYRFRPSGARGLQRTHRVGLTLDKEAVLSKLVGQKINTKNSSESELVGINDILLTV